MKLNLTYFEGVAHEFFATLGRVAFSAGFSYAIYFVTNVHFNNADKNFGLYSAGASFVLSLLYAGKQYVDNAKNGVTSTTTITAPDGSIITQP